ncbi:recombinase family protein [Nocardia abscessus]|uniref:recombinase family protein n=1 Tax=Nocardia abscessus TaxID=120957 RepID=UPI0034DCF2C7
MVQRIFRDYIAGRGDKAIAHELNREDIPCPSAHRPEQNPAPISSGWQACTAHHPPTDRNRDPQAHRLPRRHRSRPRRGRPSRQSESPPGLPPRHTVSAPTAAGGACPVDLGQSRQVSRL